MHISSLVLHGFKSFGKKTSMSFGRGITGVVGPNGCGKTNIVDALRWVLGEQKMSVLRSTRMEEIIFNGSKNRKPSSLCEVVLTIHNDKSKLPAEYTDIEISRRLYRDGESEYLINRNPCRRKDLLDLFVDTGMGSDAYSVIELKMIEAILSETGEDRRRMFEEAAGINKYKSQRVSTQRKLEATRQDLERVHDIIAEVDGQVRALGLQLKRFERHKKLGADLKGKEIALASFQIGELAQQIEPLQESLRTGRDSHTAEAAAIAKDEQQLAAFQATLDRQEQDLEAARQSFSEATEQLNELKQQQLVWEEQLRSTRQSLERFEQEQKAETERRGSHTDELVGLEKQLKSLGPELETMQSALEAKRSEEAAVTENYRDGEQRIQTAREKKFSHQHRIQDEEARHRRAAEIIGERTGELARLEQTIAAREDELAALRQQQQTLSGAKGKLETRLAGLAADLEKATLLLTELDEREANLRDEHNRVTTEVQVLQSRLDIFSELMESLEGYPSGARDVLAVKERFPDLLGTVADLVDVKADHALAVETALGPYVTCLVTATHGQARELLDYAAEHGLGRLSVIPLDRLSRHGEDGSSSLGTVPGAGVPLIELVTVPEPLTGLYQRLLADMYFGEDGASTYDDLPKGTTVVTAAGQLYGDVPVLVHLGGAATDNGQDASPPGSVAIVGRSREVDRLRQAIVTSTQAADKLARELAEFKARRAELTQHRKTIDEDTDRAVSEVNRTNRELTQLEYEQGRLTLDLKELQVQLPEMQQAIRSLETNLTTYDKVIAELNEQTSRLDETIAEAEQVYQAVREKRDVWREELQELRFNLINGENRRENLAGRRLSLEDARSASTERIAQLKTDANQARKTIDELTGRLADAVQARKGLEERVNSQAGASTEKEATTRKTREAMAQLGEQIRQLQHGREATLAGHQELELKLIEWEKQAELIRSRIREVYAAEIPEQESTTEYDDQDVLQAEIQKIQASLERIGPINMAVADEYAEESKRFNFLTEQRDDLLEAEKSLRGSIEKIDHQAREQFRETYDKIRYHFQQTFNLFFEGGEGNLRLVGDPDPLESNIEIIARPPGKATRSLRSLSAGEKALTAIALLFAIYMVKPSPFCILDEVDAPLDDVNIAKFSRVISQFAKDTQFIIVTHNKLTMERVDYLYGVTMEEEGLSRLVSVDLNAHVN